MKKTDEWKLGNGRHVQLAEWYIANVILKNYYNIRDRDGLFTIYRRFNELSIARIDEIVVSGPSRTPFQGAAHVGGLIFCKLF